MTRYAPDQSLLGGIPSTVFESNAGGSDFTHSYRWSKLPNGNYKLHDVDIFRACERQNKITGQVQKFDEQWLQDAVAKFHEDRAKGHFPPVHVGHNTEGKDTEHAGLITRIEVRRQDGVPTVFADISEIPPSVFAQIARHRIPYRSIEVNDPDKREISSLGLLTTRVPFHRMPITRVDVPEGWQFSQGPPSVYFASGPRHKMEIVQRFAGSSGPTAFVAQIAKAKFQDLSDDEIMELIESMDPEELEELLEQADMGGMGGMGGMDGGMGGMGGMAGMDGGMPDQMGEGEDDMGEVMARLEELNNTVGQLAEAVKYGQGAAPGGMPAPVPMGEAENQKVSFGQGGAASEIVAAVKMLADRVDRLEAWFEAESDARAVQQFEDRVEAVLRDSIIDTIDQMGLPAETFSEETIDEALNASMRAAQDAVRGVNFESTESFDAAVERAVQGAWHRIARIALGSAVKPPQRADRNGAATVSRVRQEAMKFAETDPTFAAMFEESPREAERMLVEASQRYDAMEPGMQKAFGSREAYIRSAIANER